MQPNTKSSGKFSASFEIRRCTARDFSWLIETAQESYGLRLKDNAATKAWLSVALENPRMLFIRTENSFVVGTINTTFFDPEPQATAPFFAGNGREVGALLKEAAQWAKENGAHEGIHFRSTTEHDISKLAAHIGAEVKYPCYLMRPDHVRPV